MKYMHVNLIYYMALSVNIVQNRAWNSLKTLNKRSNVDSQGHKILYLKKVNVLKVIIVLKNYVYSPFKVLNGVFNRLTVITSGSSINVTTRPGWNRINKK